MSPTRQKAKLEGFDIYQKQRRRESDRPMATITRTGNITLNRGVLKQLKIDPKFVELAYSSDAFAIALLFVPDQGDNAYKVRFSESGAVQVGAEPMLRHYGIDHSERRAYEPEVRGDDYVVIPLKNPM